MWMERAATSFIGFNRFLVGCSGTSRLRLHFPDWRRLTVRRSSLF